MGTYTVITITGPNEDLARVKLHKLPDFGIYSGVDWELITHTNRMVIDKQEGPRITESHYEPVPLEVHTIIATIESKYTVDGIGAWAEKFTGKRPTLEVNSREEWNTSDADEPGFTDDVWRQGEYIREESTMNGTVPVDIAMMIRDAAAALTGWQQGPADLQQAGDELAAQLRRLTATVTA